MEYIEISAKTVDEAITEALVKLGTTSDRIEYEIVEKGGKKLNKRCSYQSTQEIFCE